MGSLLFKLACTPLGMTLTGLLAVVFVSLFWGSLKNVRPAYADMMSDAAIAGFGSVADDMRKQQKNKK